MGQGRSRANPLQTYDSIQVSALTDGMHPSNIDRVKNDLVLVLLKQMFFLKSHIEFIKSFPIDDSDNEVQYTYQPSELRNLDIEFVGTPRWNFSIPPIDTYVYQTIKTKKDVIQIRGRDSYRFPSGSRGTITFTGLPHSDADGYRQIVAKLKLSGEPLPVDSSGIPEINYGVRGGRRKTRHRSSHKKGATRRRR